ncbi:MAG: hypothetical protein V7776_21790 [Halopseudomonas aestusnigri]
MLKISIEYDLNGNVGGAKVLKTMSITDVFGTSPLTSYYDYYCLGGVKC